MTEIKISFPPSVRATKIKITLGGREEGRAL